MSRDSFETSKLNWDEASEGEHRRFAWLYRRLIALRKQQIIPRLTGMKGHSGRFEVLGPCVIKVDWTLGDGSVLTLVANLSSDPFNGINVWRQDHLWLEGYASGETLDGWSAVFSLVQQAPAE